jgi:hypothetical protein
MVTSQGSMFRPCRSSLARKQVRRWRMDTMTLQRLTGRSIAGDDALARFFLERLSELTARQDAAASTPERTTLAHAAFSTFLDCLDLGLEGEAHRILGRERTEPTASGIPA